MTWGGSGPFLFDGASVEVGFVPVEAIPAPPGGFISAWCYNCNTILGDGMKKNVAGQKIGAQMITASDGSAFTGTVSVFVTGDGGTQGAGGGSVTHEGNGYHGYAPTQAETNYDHIAFTFTGTGAVSSTVQVFTDFPQTGDAFDRLGAPAGASVSADIATRLAGASYTAPPSAATIAGAVWDEAYAGHLTGGTFGDVVANLPDAATTAYTVWQADPAGWSAAADTFGKLLIDAETDAGLIKVVTDKLTFTVAGQVDANAESMNGAEILGDGSSGNLWRGA